MRLREKCDRLPLAFALALFTVVVLRCAWLSDDAYITFRTADNFISGYGPTWNTDERVQAFTHPLWMLILSAAYAITGEIHLTAIVLSVLLSLGAALLYAVRLAATPLAATVGVAALVMSKAFVDYSTSGLENPLTHLLLVCFLLVFLKRPLGDRSFLLLALLGGLAALNRMDVILIVLPGLLACWYQRRSLRTTGLLVLGFAPFLLWELFSLFYYGFLFPNTAYAKLSTGVPAGLLIQQGLFYLLNSLATDPLTPVVIAAGLVTPLLIGYRRHAPISVGIALYLLYVVWIGADFMAGRFLTAPLLCAVVLLSRSPAARSPRALLVSLGVILLLGMISQNPPLLSAERYGIEPAYTEQHGVGDERACYYPATGLLRAASTMRVAPANSRWEVRSVAPGVEGVAPSRVAPANSRWGIQGVAPANSRWNSAQGVAPANSRCHGGMHLLDHEWARAGREARAAGPSVIVAVNIGIFGFEAGPEVHIVDAFALADPLLARLRPMPIREDWRIGHFWRRIPDGYVETLRTGRNVIVDPQVANLYDTLTLITRGRLLDPHRLAAILRMNIGS